MYKLLFTDQNGAIKIEQVFFEYGQAHAEALELKRQRPSGSYTITKEEEIVWH